MTIDEVTNEVALNVRLHYKGIDERFNKRVNTVEIPVPAERRFRRGAYGFAVAEGRAEVEFLGIAPYIYVVYE